MELKNEYNRSSTLAEHAMECVKAFHKYLAAPRLRLKLTLMERYRIGFSQWTSVMKVFEPYEASLDDRLSDCPETVKKIHQLFDVLLHTITLGQGGAHTLQFEEPPTTKKRRLSASGRAEVVEICSDANKTGDEEEQDEVNVTQVTFTIGEAVMSLWSLFYDLQMSSEMVRAIPLYPSLDPGWTAKYAPISYEQMDALDRATLAVLSREADQRALPRRA